MSQTVDFILTNNLYVVSGSFVIAIIVYLLFWMPCNWSKASRYVGYHSISNQKHLMLKNKKETINRIRKCRKIDAKEIPPPYPNGWYGILESSNLKRGQAKSVFCLGEHLVVFRTNENKVYILDAYCPHMGANMGAGGRVVGDSIECPFHLWRYNGKDGKCSGVPYSTSVPLGAKVKKWISCEVNDFIFVWYHTDPDEEPWDLPFIEQIKNQNFVYHGRNEFYVNCHIQEIPENGADLAHFSAIHKQNVLTGVASKDNRFIKSIGNHIWAAVWKPSSTPNKHKAILSLTHSIEFTGKLRLFNINIQGEQLGPAYVQLHMESKILGRIEVIQVVLPVEPLVQKVIHRFYAPRLMAPLIKILIYGESVMFERDMTIWNNKVFKKKLELVKEDFLIKSFRNWYSQFYTDSSKTFSEAKENLEW